MFSATECINAAAQTSSTIAESSSDYVLPELIWLLIVCSLLVCIVLLWYGNRRQILRLQQQQQQHILNANFKQSRMLATTGDQANAERGTVGFVTDIFCQLFEDISKMDLFPAESQLISVTSIDNGDEVHQEVNVLRD